MTNYTSKDIVSAYRAIVAGAGIEETFRALVHDQMTDSERLVYEFVRGKPFKNALQISLALPLERVHVSMILLRLTRQGILLRELHKSARRRDQYVYYDGLSAAAPGVGERKTDEP